MQFPFVAWGVNVRIWKMPLFSIGTFSLKYSLKTRMKNHNSWKDGPLLLITPDIKGRGTWSSSCSAEDRDSDHRKERNYINLGLGCTNFPEAVCPHFKLSSNTNTDLKPKFRLSFTSCWFQISDFTLLSVKGGRPWCISDRTGSEVEVSHCHLQRKCCYKKFGEGSLLSTTY